VHSGSSAEASRVLGRWTRTLLRTARDLDRENLPIIAGGLAFFALLSGTPLLVALVSVYRMVADPVEVTSLVKRLAEKLPEDIHGFVIDHIDEILGHSFRQAGFGAALSVLGALWIGSKGTFYLFRALNVAYGVTETRGLIRLKATVFVFTLLLLVATALTIATVSLLPRVLRQLAARFDVGPSLEMAIRIARWPVLAVLLMAMFGLLYRFGPAHKTPPRRGWLAAGTITAALGSIVCSWLFTWYVSTFGAFKFGEIYGSLATFVLLMLWLYLSASLLLLGAVINANAAQRPSPSPSPSPVT
jgi:membrane protein